MSWMSWSDAILSMEAPLDLTTAFMRQWADRPDLDLHGARAHVRHRQLDDVDDLDRIRRGAGRQRGLPRFLLGLRERGVATETAKS